MQHFHFIGIGGIGMSALARILLSQKFKVTGSDLQSTSVIESLKCQGADIYIGHEKENVQSGSVVVYNSMITKDHPELSQAFELKCQVLHRSDLLKLMANSYKLLAVTGTHGKTTTSSLLATVLRKARLDPAFAIGGILVEDEINGGFGRGEYFVIEADESDASFLKYSCLGAIVTNIDNDHLDHYGSLDNLKDAFSKFMSQVKDKSLLFFCKDDARLLTLAQQGISYGFNSHSELLGSNFRQDGWRCFFDIHFRGKKYEAIELALVGKHLALNALAVFGMGISLGISEEIIREAFKHFGGVKRRCEKKCHTKAITVIDDYGHHPTEIKTTLKAIREAVGERRLIAIFQPHRYSRVEQCFEEFITCFDEADLLIVTDIYSACEQLIPDIHAKKIVDRIRKESSLEAFYVSEEQLKWEIIDQARPHDVIVFFNAGHLTQMAAEVGNYFKLNAPKKLSIAVLYGGRSSEHDISLKSAEYILSALDQDLYIVTPFFLTKEGHWHAIGHQEKIDSCQKQLKAIESLLDCDIAIPVFHGPYGEDGTIQGCFETFNIPYVGCCHRSSAICMDKALTKHLVQKQGIKTAEFIDFSYAEWKESSKNYLKKIEEELTYPLFVKPSHLGSSIGVSRVSSREDLLQAIEKAFLFDTHLLIEEELKGREIEFCVLGNHKLFIPKPGEICTQGKFYDYEAKYGPEGMSTEIPANISDDLYLKGKAIAAEVYKILKCSGLARVDFFLDDQNHFWLNEVNPFPGFTQISVYPKALEKSGVSSSELIDRLVILGLERKRMQERHLKALP